MHFVYIDDSKDQNKACFSALIIPTDRWQYALDAVIGIRQAMKQSDGIYIRKEMHATDWLGGKGAIARHPVNKERRARLYDFFLSGIANLPSAQLINAAVPMAEESRAFEWLLNRVNVNMSKSGSEAIIFSDEGKSYDQLLRKMRRHNPITSRYGLWAGGRSYRNITIDRILEDIIYRDSARSLLIQAADCCAYAVLRRESPVASKTALGLNASFGILDRILVKAANTNDPDGIIR